MKGDIVEIEEETMNCLLAVFKQQWGGQQLDVGKAIIHLLALAAVLSKHVETSKNIFVQSATEAWEQAPKDCLKADGVTLQ